MHIVTNGFQFSVKSLLVLKREGSAVCTGRGRPSIRRPRLPLGIVQGHDRVFRVPPVDLCEADVPPVAGQPCPSYRKVLRAPSGGLGHAVDPLAQLTLPPPAEGVAAIVQDDLPVHMSVVRPFPAAGDRGGLRFFPVRRRFFRRGRLALLLIQMLFFGIYLWPPSALRRLRGGAPAGAAGSMRRKILAMTADFASA